MPLPAQLTSLYEQTFQEFHILVGDDGSTDGTVAILEAAAMLRPHQIRLIHRNRVGGAQRNFMRLVAAADAPYVMFCDQDDVWLP